MRPLLSHDKKQLQVKITDKSAEGGHKTKDIIILGYPTVIFLSVNTSLDSQERTRNLLLSAEVSQPKIKDSIIQTAEKLSDRKTFSANLERNSDRFDLKNRVRQIKECAIEEILITTKDRDYITNIFLSEHNHLEPRHMRDFPRLIACIKGHALLNLFNRQRTRKKVWATRHDWEVGEANEHDIPPHIYKFWIEALNVVLTSQGMSRKEVSSSYKEFYKTRIGSKALKRLIETLGEAGLVYEDKDPNDKRYLLIYPLGGGGKNNIQVDPGERMIERAASLLAENGGSLGYRDFFNKMNAFGYQNKDINNVVFSDPYFIQDGFMVKIALKREEGNR